MGETAWFYKESDARLAVSFARGLRGPPRAQALLAPGGFAGGRRRRAHPASGAGEDAAGAARAPVVFIEGIPSGVLSPC